jgi:hypothetical protein
MYAANPHSPSISINELEIRDSLISVFVCDSNKVNKIQAPFYNAEPTNIDSDSVLKLQYFLNKE